MLPLTDSPLKKLNIISRFDSEHKSDHINTDQMAVSKWFKLVQVLVASGGKASYPFENFRCNALFKSCNIRRQALLKICFCKMLLITGEMTWAIFETPEI